jgi:hypothetical protein
MRRPDDGRCTGRRQRALRQVRPSPAEPAPGVVVVMVDRNEHHRPTPVEAMMPQLLASADVRFQGGEHLISQPRKQRVKQRQDLHVTGPTVAIRLDNFDRYDRGTVNLHVHFRLWVTS